MTDRVCFDSSCWIERLQSDAAQRAQDALLHELGAVHPVVVPATVLFEVRRWALRVGFPEEVVETISTTIESMDFVPMDATIACRAADTSTSAGLALADASILATARHRFATLLTYDRDFVDVPGVVVLDVPDVPGD